MAAISTIIAGAALGVAAVGTGYSIYKDQQAQKQAKKAAAAQRQQAALSEARQKRDAIKQARVAYAQAQAASANQNVSTSSAASGGSGSIISQLGDNLSFLDQYGMFTDQAQKHLGKMQSYEVSGRLASQVADLGMTAFANAPKIAKVFGG